MDPFSIISGVAGISQAGASLSKLIYDIISGARNAPREAFDIARGVSDLSIILSELRRILKDGKDIYSRKLLRRVSSAMKRISRLHGLISAMLDVSNAAARLMWTFRRSKATSILYQIESHKTGINMILHIMVLAVQSKQLKKVLPSATTDIEKFKSEKEEVTLARQQAENLVQISYHSIRDLLQQNPQSNPQAEHDQDDPSDEGIQGSDEPNNEDGIPTAHNQVVLRKSQHQDAALWLYELVFAATANLDLSEDPQKNKSMSTATDEDAPEISSTSTEIILHQKNHVNHLQPYAQQPEKRKSVINELLAEWTNLTEDEIKAADIEIQESSKSESNLQVIRFKDAVGRKFTFPWDVAKNWKGIEGYIKEAFNHVDIIGPHVQAGHYDLIGPEGDIILPSTWEVLIRPSHNITMVMWTMNDTPNQNNARLPPRPPGARPMSGSVPLPPGFPAHLGMRMPGVPGGGPPPPPPSAALGRGRHVATTGGIPPAPSVDPRLSRPQSNFWLDKKSSKTARDSRPMSPLSSTSESPEPAPRSKSRKQGTKK